jgi:hypothetical protein
MQINAALMFDAMVITVHAQATGEQHDDRKRNVMQRKVDWGSRFCADHIRCSARSM